MLKLKQMEKEKEKVIDKQYINNSFSHWDEYEDRRQRFLNEYKDFSDKFYEIQKQAKPNPPLEFKSKEDELRALEYQNAQAEYLRRKEYEEKISQMRSYKDNSQALLHQIKEKQEHLIKARENDKIYAQNIAERQRRLESFVNEERLRNRAKQRQYSQNITEQIQEKRNDLRNLWKMNEDEKKINRKDIESFMLGSPQLYAKIPGTSMTPTSNMSYSPTPARGKGNLSQLLHNPQNTSYMSGRSTPTRFANYSSNILQNN